jgi:acyl-CoA synthetase (AMP-forming)/AMP-acid ligase II
MIDCMTLEEVLAQDFHTLPVRDRITAVWVALDDSAAGTSFRQWLVAAGTVPAAVVAEPDAPFNRIYSSGTTGTPKGIEQSNRMRWRQWRRAFDYDYKPDSVTIVSTPLYLNPTLVSFLPTLAVGGVVVLMAKFDADGFLILMDRKKDMIISGGFNVYPSDLELVPSGHADEAEAAAVDVPSERWGETPVAFVVGKRAYPQLAKTLLEWANSRLGKTQRLAAVELVESLPRSAIGKVLKRELRDTYKNKALALQ